MTGFLRITILTAAGLIAAAYLIKEVGQTPQNPEPPAAVAVQSVLPPPPPPEAAMDIKSFSWKRGGFDSVAIATFTINNDNAISVRDINIKCQFYANSGTLIDIKTDTVYEIIKAKKSKTIKDFNLGFADKQATGLRCRIVSARWN